LIDSAIFTQVKVVIECARNSVVQHQKHTTTTNTFARRRLTALLQVANQLLLYLKRHGRVSTLAQSAHDTDGYLLNPVTAASIHECHPYTVRRY